MSDTSISNTLECREEDSRHSLGYPFVSIHNAVVRRDGKNILSIDDLTIDNGESIAVLGPNGAGKSTFIKLITREILPLHREEPPVLFRGNARATLAETKKLLGVVSSSMQDQITVHLSALEIVAGGLYGSLGIPRGIHPVEEDWERARAALEQLGIAELAQRDVMTMSTGQMRRVLIARALVHNPHVLIFDEPCTGLDPEGMYHVRKTMEMLSQEGHAIVLITHYPEDIIKSIHRLIMIKDGLVFADGAKEDLLTSETVSELFNAPLRVADHEGFYSIF